MRRTYSPMLFLTDILLCMRAIMESFSHCSSYVLNVRMFRPVASVRKCSTLWPCTSRALSPRSFGLTLLMLFSTIHVLSRMFAIPARSSSGAYWMLPIRGENAGSGIVMERFSQSSGSSRFVLSSTLSTGAHCSVWWKKNQKSNFGFGLWEGVLPVPYLISAMANWLPASENVIFYPYEASKLWLIWKILQKWHFLTTIFVLLSKILRVRESTWVSSSELMWDTIIYPVEGSQAVRIGARPKNVTFFGG